MTVIVLGIFEPLLAGGERAHSPHAYSEHQQLVLGRYPEDVFEEEVVAVDD